eukprot:CAMPEP_0178903992 /NCGR_PEP_ID=MMETSP0786-20121207/5459_1 /TAXON_ID=186022 /ORGANISM="Thalassionema frauenfeldii, Strain CCMP 1798" /LENGTH=476 /DNA_ID=CAMNT_0020575413 /DNA_START=166 /DNA_END=1593 /DNA_ORIENTATION=-
MTISFSSNEADDDENVHGAIWIGTKPNEMNRLVIEQEDPLYYTSAQPGHVKDYTSPLQHHITVTDLKPQTTYYYRIITRKTVGELKELSNTLKEIKVAENILKEQEKAEFYNGTKASNRRELFLRQRRLAPPPYDSTQCACPDPDKVRFFRTFSRAGHGNPVFGVIGDIGQFPHSEETLEHLKKHFGDKIDSIILAGDLAYPELDHRRWDTFMDFLDDYPLVEYIPMHITPGNHDIDKPENGTNIFSAYEVRFRMPRIREVELGLYEGGYGKLDMNKPPYPLPYEYGNAYYAFQYGKTHQIYLNSYSRLDPGSKQYEWLVQELESVNRHQTPWLLVTFHVPIYNTFEVHQHDEQMFKMREHIEPLLVSHKVNVVFNGHIHAYQRTKPVAFGNVSDTGPIHIVMGAGGRNADATFLNEEPEEWVAVRDGTIYGYGVLEICNNSHARWDWVHTGQKGDYNKVYHQNISLPAGGTDHAY